MLLEAGLPFIVQHLLLNWSKPSKAPGPKDQCLGRISRSGAGNESWPQRGQKVMECREACKKKPGESKGWESRAGPWEKFEDFN